MPVESSHLEDTADRPHWAKGSHPSSGVPLIRPGGKAAARFLGAAVAGLVIDLTTKWLAVRNLKESGESVQFIPNLLHFDYIENRGAVFGIGQGQTALFLAVSVGATLFLFYLFWKSAGQRVYQIVLGGLLAGVLGNFYDRLVFGHVRDMLHMLPGWNYPEWVRNTFPQVELFQSPLFPYIFNVADVLLCCGVGILLLMSLFGGDKRPKAAPTIATPAPETTL